MYRLLWSPGVSWVLTHSHVAAYFLMRARQFILFLASDRHDKGPFLGDPSLKSASGSTVTFADVGLIDMCHCSCGVGWYPAACYSLPYYAEVLPGMSCTL